MKYLKSYLPKGSLLDTTILLISTLDFFYKQLVYKQLYSIL